MSQEWLRLYRSALNNPKVQKLGLEAVGFWCNCLCASNDDGELPSAADLAWTMRLDVTVVETFLKRFIETNLLDHDGERYALHDWAEHQFRSDVSTGRVRKYRQSNKEKRQVSAETDDETAMKRFRNVSETPPEQNRDRAETEQKEEDSVAKATAAAPQPNPLKTQSFETARSLGINGGAVGKAAQLCGNDWGAVSEVLGRCRLHRPANPTSWFLAEFQAHGRDPPRKTKLREALEQAQRDGRLPNGDGRAG